MNKLTKPILILFCLLPFSVLADNRAELYFVDAHSQIDKDTSIETVIDLMDQSGVYGTLLATRRGRKPPQVLDFASQYKGRIIPILATKQYGYIYDSDNKGRRFIKKLNKLSRRGYQGLGEVLMWHSGCPNVACLSVRREHSNDRVQSILTVADMHGWPFIAHIEFGSLGSSEYAVFMAGLEKLLTQYHPLPFALIHMGQLASSEVRRLITKHKNIHFLTAHANPEAIEMAGGFKPWVNMFKGERLTNEWEKLVIDSPERFIFALDNVWGEKYWQEYEYKTQMKYWRNAMKDLPVDITHSVTHGNAESLWKIPPKNK